MLSYLADRILHRFRLLIRVLRCFSDQGLAVIRLLIIIAIATVIGLASVWPLAWLVDSVLVAAPPEPIPFLAQWLHHDRWAQIIALAVLVLVLRIGQELLNGWRGLLGLQIGHAGILRLRGELFAKLQELSVLFHRRQPQGETIYRLTRDTGGCQQVLDVSIEVLVATFTLIAMLAVMAARSVPLTLVALAVIPLLLATNVAFGRALRRRSRAARSAETDFTSTVQRAVSTISLTQAFGRELDEQRRFSDRSQKSLQAWFELHRRLTWYRICVGLIFGSGNAAIFGWGGWMAWSDQIQGHNPDGMTVGSLVVFVAYLGMLYDPLCKLSGAGTNMLDGMTGMERIFEVIDRDAGVPDSPNAISLPLLPRTLSLRNVGYAYDAGQPVLRNVSLDIGPGEMVAFIGNSGGGKSTILQLLCRFFDPVSGSVTIDEFDFRDVRLKDLRRHIAVVFQDSVMLPTTIAENIGYGRPTANLDEIRQAAELAGAAEFIESLADGYATELAEGGGNLSGGQRQRLAIARALLTEAPIIVLDEPTSALDLPCEQHIIQTLRRLKGERTIVLVSHRLSAVRDSDCIHILREGAIVDSGTWYELAERRQLPVASMDESSAAQRNLEPSYTN